MDSNIPEVEAPALVVEPQTPESRTAKIDEEGLRTQGERDEVSLKSQGSRDAETLRTQGNRDARVLFTAGQRQVNLIWEGTQAAIAVLVVLTTCIGIFVGRVLVENAGVSFPPEWWTILGLVIGFYFGRTNHSRQGDEPAPVRMN